MFYTGAAVNQQAIPAVEYLMSEEGGAYKKFYLLGTDYVYPRTTNKILRAMLLAKAFQRKTLVKNIRHSIIKTIKPLSEKFENFRAGVMPQ